LGEGRKHENEYSISDILAGLAKSLEEGPSPSVRVSLREEKTYYRMTTVIPPVNVDSGGQTQPDIFFGDLFN
jgi:hypothetical protein